MRSPPWGVFFALSVGGQARIPDVRIGLSSLSSNSVDSGIRVRFVGPGQMARLRFAIRSTPQTSGWSGWSLACGKTTRSWNATPSVRATRRAGRWSDFSADLGAAGLADCFFRAVGSRPGSCVGGRCLYADVDLGRRGKGYGIMPASSLLGAVDSWPCLLCPVLSAAARDAAAVAEWCHPSSRS